MEHWAVPVACQNEAATTNIRQYPEDEEVSAHQRTASWPKRLRRPPKRQVRVHACEHQAPGIETGSCTAMRRYCRVEPYLIKASALRAAAPAAHAPGVRPLGADPPRRGGQTCGASRHVTSARIALSPSLDDMTTSGPTKRRCVFCRNARKITLEHLVPTWMTSGENESRHLYVRESGGPDYQPRRDVREGPARDLTAKGPCDRCNNGWMNEIDHGAQDVLDALGPQLIRGKRIKLTKTKKTALATWAAKYALMFQLTHERGRRFAIPEDDYSRFYDERTPGKLMRLWTGYMEPPGKHGGPALAFTDGTLNETYHDPQVLERAGLSAELASKDYSAVFRFGHCVIGLYRARPEILEVVRLINPRAWVQIWPAVGTTEWPPAEPLPTGLVDPRFAGLHIASRFPS